MSLENFSLKQLEDLWIKLWQEMFELEVESDETKETATVLQEFVRRVNYSTPNVKENLQKERPKKEEKDTTKEDPKDLKTLSQWNAEGRWIKKGERAKAFQKGVAVFAFEQTREAQPRKSFKENTGSKGKYDDYEDDIPF